MKKTIKEYDKDGNLVKETIIEEEEKYKFIPQYPYCPSTYWEEPFCDDGITVTITEKQTNNSG